MQSKLLVKVLKVEPLLSGKQLGRRVDTENIISLVFSNVIAQQRHNIFLTM